MSAPASREDFVVKSGEGLIEVRGDEFEAGLLVDGMPIVLYWSDCAGNFRQYLTRSRDLSDLNQRFGIIHQFAEDGVQPGRSLAAQVAPLLRLFPNARYRLRYNPAYADYQVVTAHPNDCIHFYPEPRPLVPTRPLAALRLERVNYFREQIRAGARPVVIAVEQHGGWCSFLLDGHHKLQAYQDNRVPLALLVIEVLRCGSLSVRDGLRFVEGEEHREAYVRLKRAHGAIETEEDWLAATQPVHLWDRIRSRVGNRKCRLFVCACCRQLRGLLPGYARAALLVAEQHADGLATGDALAAVHQTIIDHLEPERQRCEGSGLNIAAAATAEFLKYCPTPDGPAAEALLRHIFGNPFRPYPTPAYWPAAVMELAQALYDGAGNPLVLADALEEAGHQKLADHFRAEPWHPKGCWVIDTILGKE